MLAIDFAVVLATAIPGLVVWAIGQMLVIARARGGGSSPIGLRLTLIGLGLAVLGPLAAVVLASMTAGYWAVAVLLVVAGGWLPIALFWLAARRQVAAKQAPPSAS